MIDIYQTNTINPNSEVFINGFEGKLLNFPLCSDNKGPILRTFLFKKQGDDFYTPMNYCVDNWESTQQGDSVFFYIKNHWKRLAMLDFIKQLETRVVYDGKIKSAEGFLRGFHTFLLKESAMLDNYIDSPQINYHNHTL